MKNEQNEQIGIRNEEIDINNEKKIIFNGTNNRYQMKKIMKTIEKDKLRKSIQKSNFSMKDYSFEKQIEILLEMKENKYKDKIHSFFQKELERKIASYKQQDIEKKIVDPTKIVSYEIVLSLLLESNGKCFYCKGETFVLYEKVREQKQWTLDRIDNHLGHNSDNVVISCLECNLKRRCQSKDGFLFTKQLKIIKS